MFLEDVDRFLTGSAPIISADVVFVTMAESENRNWC
jgi:hypothetical protein